MYCVLEINLQPCHQSIEQMNRIVAIISYIFFYIILSANADINIDTLNFKVQSEGLSLDAQLIKKSSKENLPVIIFLVGSGGTSSHKTNYKDFTEFFFEKTFLENDFAIVYFDKRGVGESEGVWFETNFEQRAADAANVAKALHGFEFIDKNKIFLVGHSQGGWIAQIAVSNHPELFAAGVSMAGATFGVKKQLINDYMSEKICKKGNSESRALKKATKKADRDLKFINRFAKKGNWKQLKIIQDFEPRRYIFHIEKPFYFMFGENDELVDVKWAIDEFQTIFPSGKPSHIKYYIALSETHSFKKAKKCFDRDWKNVPYSEDTQKVLFDWILEESIR
jgi:dipeptidyl aminopeptidase/acylaminoacyl peptidase